MSLQDHSAAAGASIHENHYCCVDGCGKWGGLGLSRSKGEPPQWWCARHYPHWPEHIAARYAAEAVG